jgi:hypothetical protein
MNTIRTIALVAAAAGALAMGSAALAQEEKKPEAATKPQASHEHKRGHAQHGPRGMSGMRGGRCHGESQGSSGGEHNHS